MTPIVFINTKDVPFVDYIINGDKKYETRTRNTLGGLDGRRVLLAETGHGKPIVRCSAKLSLWMATDSEWLWDQLKEDTCVPDGSKYDWNEKTKVKWLYKIDDVHPISPFNPPEGKRHGRVWMEYEEV